MVAILRDEEEHPDAKTKTVKMRAIRGKIIMWRFASQRIGYPRREWKPETKNGRYPR
jgi:hypothetical protein